MGLPRDWPEFRYWARLCNPRVAEDELLGLFDDCGERSIIAWLLDGPPEGPVAKAIGELLQALALSDRPGGSLEWQERARCEAKAVVVNLRRSREPARPAAGGGAWPGHAPQEQHEPQATLRP